MKPAGNDIKTRHLQHLTKETLTGMRYRPALNATSPAMRTPPPAALRARQ